MQNPEERSPESGRNRVTQQMPPDLILSTECLEQTKIMSPQMKQQTNVMSPQMKEQTNVMPPQMKEEPKLMSTQMKEETKLMSTQMKEESKLMPTQMKEESKLMSTRINEETSMKKLGSGPSQQMKEEPKLMSTRINEETSMKQLGSGPSQQGIQDQSDAKEERQDENEDDEEEEDETKGEEQLFEVQTDEEMEGDAVDTFGKGNAISDSTCKKKYQVITQEIREKFIQKVTSKQVTIKEAAKQFGLKFSTSKAILQTYKKEGRIGKKKTRQRKPRLIKKMNEHPINSNGLIPQGLLYAESPNNTMTLIPQVLFHNEVADVNGLTGNPQSRMQMNTPSSRCIQQNHTLQNISPFTSSSSTTQGGLQYFQPQLFNPNIYQKPQQQQHNQQQIQYNIDQSFTNAQNPSFLQSPFHNSSLQNQQQLSNQQHSGQSLHHHQIQQQLHQQNQQAQAYYQTPIQPFQQSPLSAQQPSIQGQQSNLINQPSSLTSNSAFNPDLYSNIILNGGIGGIGGSSSGIGGIGGGSSGIGGGGASVNQMSQQMNEQFQNIPLKQDSISNFGVSPQNLSFSTQQHQQQQVQQMKFNQQHQMNSLFTQSHQPTTAHPNNIQYAFPMSVNSSDFPPRIHNINTLSSYNSQDPNQQLHTQQQPSIHFTPPIQQNNRFNSQQQCTPQPQLQMYQEQNVFQQQQQSLPDSQGDKQGYDSSQFTKRMDDCSRSNNIASNENKIKCENINNESILNNSKENTNENQSSLLKELSEMQMLNQFKKNTSYTHSFPSMDNNNCPKTAPMSRQLNNTQFLGNPFSNRNESNSFESTNNPMNFQILGSNGSIDNNSYFQNKLSTDSLNLGLFAPNSTNQPYGYPNIEFASQYPFIFNSHTNTSNPLFQSHIQKNSIF